MAKRPRPAATPEDMDLEARGNGMVGAAATLYPRAEEARLCRVMVAPAVLDGLTGAARPSVDNLPLGPPQALLETLRDLIGHLKTRRGPMAAARVEETA